MRYLLFLLGTFFVALKAFDVVAWSWWWVMSPFIAIGIGYILAGAVVLFVIAKYAQQNPDDVKKLSEYLKKKNRR